MDSRPAVWVFGFLVLGFVGGQVGGAGVASRSCGFPAVYNFGDSNSDTGARSAALGVVPPPNGVTFFEKPSGRVCDGRLIIDFIGKQESVYFYLVNKQDALSQISLCRDRRECVLQISRSSFQCAYNLSVR